MMYFLRGCLIWMMTEMISRITTKPQVIPMMVRLVLSRVSRMLAFLFSGYGDKYKKYLKVHPQVCVANTLNSEFPD